MKPEAADSFVIRTTEVQAQLKKLVLDDVIKGVPQAQTKQKAARLIDGYVKTVPERTRKQEVKESLAKAFAKWYRLFAGFAAAAFFITGRMKKELAELVPRKESFKGFFFDIPLRDKVISGEIGTPVVRDYVRKTKRAFEQTCRRVAKEQAMYDKGVSLRNIAEMEVRYQETLQELASLKQRGVNLVWASTHANCSERCAPYQGRLYSLDGSYGAIHGIRFVPLELATDIVYYTRSGKGYKNGLLGFNCRHRLIPYAKGKTPPQDFTEARMARERRIDAKQRRMERSIRQDKELAFMLRGHDHAQSMALFGRARIKSVAYREYSAAHGRTAYISRTRIMTEELQNG